MSVKNEGQLLDVLLTAFRHHVPGSPNLAGGLGLRGPDADGIGDAFSCGPKSKSAKLWPQFVGSRQQAEVDELEKVPIPFLGVVFIAHNRKVAHPITALTAGVEHHTDGHRVVLSTITARDGGCGV